MISGIDPLRGWGRRSPEAWADRLEVPVLELHRSLTSTNDRARELAREGAPALATVVAGEQTRGRGRGGKAWISEGGRGLWMSVLLSGRAGGTSALLSPVVGVAAALGVEAVLGRALAGADPSAPALRVGLKWPNDLFLPGGKVGGVLCEAVSGPGPPRAVAGIGVNLRPPEGGFPDGMETAPASLEELTGTEVSPPDLARAILEELRRWAEPVPDGLTEALGRQWSERDLLEGRTVACEAGPVGRAAGLSAEGALLVEERGGGTVPVWAGSVRLVTDPEGHGRG